jgi:hypothetical protein
VDLGVQLIVLLAKMINVSQTNWHAIVMTIVGMAVTKRKDARVISGYFNNV